MYCRLRQRKGTNCGGNRQTFATRRGSCRPYDKDRDFYNQMDRHYRQTSTTNIHRKCRKAYQQFLHNGSCAFVPYKPTGPPTDTTVILHGVKTGALFNEGLQMLNAVGLAGCISGSSRMAVRRFTATCSCRRGAGGQ